MCECVKDKNMLLRYIKVMYGMHNVQLFSNAQDSTRDGSKCGCNVSCRRQISCIPPAAQFAMQQFYKVDESNTMTGDDRRRAMVLSIM